MGYLEDGSQVLYAPYPHSLEVVSYDAFNDVEHEMKFHRV